MQTIVYFYQNKNIHKIYYKKKLFNLKNEIKFKLYIIKFIF